MAPIPPPVPAAAVLDHVPEGADIIVPLANGDVVIRRAKGNSLYDAYHLPGMKLGQTNVRRDEGRRAERETRHAESRAAWRAWLVEHHGTERGVWLCSWKAATGRPTCAYADAVEEALCFGWIDSTVNTLDDERGLQLMTPRKPKSSWTRLNRQRVAELEAAGLMTDAGRRVVEAAQASGWWTLYDTVEDLIEPPGLAAALDKATIAPLAVPLVANITARLEMLSSQTSGAVAIAAFSGTGLCG